jgi:phosphoglucosamine mutase
VAPAVYEELGAEVINIHNTPNGTKINAKAGATAPDAMRCKVIETKAHLGIAVDGDADRVVMCDEHGQVVDGDAVMALCATRMLAAGELKKNTVVATVMSNIGLERAIKAAGGQLVRTAVGDRYVVEEMRKNGYNFGGEQSGHLIFLDHMTTGDGIIAALRVLAIMAREQRKLSELAHVMVRSPQVLVNVRVAEKKPLEDLPVVLALIDKIAKDLGDQGRVLVRYSGTESKARVMVEGPDEATIRARAEEVAEELARQCGPGLAN